MNLFEIFIGIPTAKTKHDNLYCYCRRPYDEVSEMIACDAEDCRIEWFHFECVGITVVPQDTWFCPECRNRSDRKQLNLPMRTTTSFGVARISQPPFASPDVASS